MSYERKNDLEICKIAATQNKGTIQYMSYEMKKYFANN
jgi:hypothetical protein